MVNPFFRSAGRTGTDWGRKLGSHLMVRRLDGEPFFGSAADER